MRSRPASHVMRCSRTPLHGTGLLTTGERHPRPARRMRAASQDVDGAHDRNRTGDLLLTMEMLYRLSYVGETSAPAPCWTAPQDVETGRWSDRREGFGSLEFVPCGKDTPPQGGLRWRTSGCRANGECSAPPPGVSTPTSKKIVTCGIRGSPTVGSGRARDQAPGDPTIRRVAGTKG